jgi:hypothetical protein
MTNLTHNTVWYAGQEGPDLHTRRPPTQSDIRHTYTRCCIGAIDSPDDEHGVARNM